MQIWIAGKIKISTSLLWILRAIGKIMTMQHNFEKQCQTDDSSLKKGYFVNVLYTLNNSVLKSFSKFAAT